MITTTLMSLGLLLAGTPHAPADLPTIPTGSPATVIAEHTDAAVSRIDVQDPAAIWAIVTTFPQFFGSIDVDSFVQFASGWRPWTMWYCEYADGTLVFNQFRFYRSSTDVLNYFVGRPGSHDCDAYYFDDAGNRYSFCTRSAYAFARAHGGIVEVGHAQ